MRAQDESGSHLSGMERLVFDNEMDEALAALQQRGRAVGAHRIVLTSEAIAEPIATVPILNLVNSAISTGDTVRRAVRERLQIVGIPPEVAHKAMDLLDRGPAIAGGNMRGAVLMGCDGTRLEPDGNRGIRTVRVDVHPEDRDLIGRKLAQQGFSHHRTKEALVLSTKTLWAGVVAELGWSDDPDYTTGFVACQGTYWRFPHIKPSGNPYGGRVYFVTNGAPLDSLIMRLQTSPVWVRAGQLDLDG